MQSGRIKSLLTKAINEDMVFAELVPVALAVQLFFEIWQHASDNFRIEGVSA